MIGPVIDNVNSEILGVSFVIVLFITVVALLVFFIYKNSTISQAIKKTFNVLLPVSLATYITLKILNKESPVNEYLIDGSVFLVFFSMILLIIVHLEKIQIILYGFIVALIAGFIMNRLGMSEGQYFIVIFFLLSSLGFIYLIFKTIPVCKVNKGGCRILLFFFGINSILNALFFLKFTENNPAFISVYDILGVAIFIIACLVLFISLPFSDFTEWHKTQKQSFKRLVLTPLIFFLIIFSLKFLLPDNTYKRIFFREYSENKKTYFEMKDYDIDFSKKN